MATRLSIKRVDDLLKPLGVRCKSDGFGEFRVYYTPRHAGRRELDDTCIMSTAYYTNDLADALATGQHMAANL